MQLTAELAACSECTLLHSCCGVPGEKARIEFVKFGQILANFGKFWQIGQIFNRAFLGCIDADCSDQWLIFQDFSRSTELSNNFQQICKFCQKKIVNIFTKFANFVKFSVVHFSAVSTPIAAINGSFCSIFRDLPDFLKIFTKSLHFSKEKLQNLRKFSENLQNFRN